MRATTEVHLKILRLLQQHMVELCIPHPKAHPEKKITGNPMDNPVAYQYHRIQWLNGIGAIIG